VLRGPRRVGIKAIVVYPMNALANSQEQELQKFLTFGYQDGRGPVTFRRYTGQENEPGRLRRRRRGRVPFRLQSLRGFIERLPPHVAGS
jgi:ATP-dependent helicase YprA (DUF1998 family)